MAIPKATIVIKKGTMLIEGKEKTDNCFKLSELAKSAGKIETEKPKDHTPVYHSVNTKGA